MWVGVSELAPQAQKAQTPPDLSAAERQLLRFWTVALKKEFRAGILQLVSDMH